MPPGPGRGRRRGLARRPRADPARCVSLPARPRVVPRLARRPARRARPLPRGPSLRPRLPRPRRRAPRARRPGPAPALQPRPQRRLRAHRRRPRPRPGRGHRAASFRSRAPRAGRAGALAAGARERALLDSPCFPRALDAQGVVSEGPRLRPRRAAFRHRPASGASWLLAARGAAGVAHPGSGLWAGVRGGAGSSGRRRRSRPLGVGTPAVLPAALSGPARPGVPPRARRPAPRAPSVAWRRDR